MKSCSRCGIKHSRNHGWCLECHNSNMKTWRKNNPLTEKQKIKDRARSYAGVYLRKGMIKKDNCVECGSSKSQMHHPDYTKPLDIIWLCRQCHMALHKEKSWAIS